VDDLKHMIWLAHLYGPGSQYIDYLLTKFGSAEGVYNASQVQLRECKSLPEGVLSKIIYIKQRFHPDKMLFDMEKKGIHFISKFSDSYPPLLQDIPNPPFGLFILGNMPDFDKLWISIIGTRRPTSYGRTAAHKISKELAEKGVIIVSGMADGLDAVANKGALDMGQPTAAVLGSGVDICYPAVNEKIYEAIKEKGCLISEFPPGTNTDRWHFPLRNRIISGLSLALIVIESGIKSGTMITVNHALEQGREVLAVPGNITSARSEGTNKLIKEGAHVATCAMDVLDALGIVESENLYNINEEIYNNENIPLAPNEKTVYALLGDEPIDLDDIVQKSELDPRSVLVALTKLGLAGKISELPGQKYTR